MNREQMEKDARIIIANDGWGQHHAVRLAHWLLAALAPGPETPMPEIQLGDQLLLRRSDNRCAAMTRPEALARVGGMRNRLLAYLRHVKLPNDVEYQADAAALTLVLAEVQRLREALVGGNKLLGRFLDHHCQLSEWDGLGALCECDKCADTRKFRAAMEAPDEP